MNKYIDVNEVEKLMKCGCAYAIWELPSIDIIKCEECRYKQQCHKAVEHTTRDWTSVTITYRPIEFCSYGEREGE